MLQIKTLIVVALVSFSAAFSVDQPPQSDRRSLLVGGAAALVAGLASGTPPANAALGSGTPVGREIGKKSPHCLPTA